MAHDAQRRIRAARGSRRSTAARTPLRTGCRQRAPSPRRAGRACRPAGPTAAQNSARVAARAAGRTSGRSTGRRSTTTACGGDPVQPHGFVALHLVPHDHAIGRVANQRLAGQMVPAPHGDRRRQPRGARRPQVVGLRRADDADERRDQHRVGLLFAQVARPRRGWAGWRLRRAEAADPSSLRARPASRPDAAGKVHREGRRPLGRPRAQPWAWCRRPARDTAADRSPGAAGPTSDVHSPASRRGASPAVTPAYDAVSCSSSADPPTDSPRSTARCTWCPRSAHRRITDSKLRK